MKKVVAFLLALIIFVAPVTTLVKADVVIGDNDATIINENATILGRKLAMLESLSDLALSGVTDFTISNTEDVDSYLDSLWSEINDAIDYLDSGEWVGDIPDNIASKYYTNLVKYRDIVNNRGEFLGFDLQNPATSLLKTYFANDTYGKKYTSTNLYGSLDTFRALSVIRGGGSSPEIPPDFSFLENSTDFVWYGTNNIYAYQSNLPMWYNASWTNNPVSIQNMSFSTLVTGTLTLPFNQNNLVPLDLLSIYINDIDNNNTVTCSYSTLRYAWSPNNNTSYPNGYVRLIMGNGINNNRLNISSYDWAYNNQVPSYQTSFAGLSTCVNYIYQHFRHVNIYYNGEPWVLVGDSTPSQPTLDIDGLLKIFGNNNPVQYELQPNTQIDYDELYQVIYNAIRDNLPISQGDINYYDSHDTIYSPTIINNYGEEDGDESDLIDTILDYAVIPKFDTAIAQPMRQALTNGVVIMNNSITNVIPDEILLILGACFFLLLFAVVINRMIK